MNDRIIYTLWFKITVFISTVLCIATAATSALFAVFAFAEDLYITPKQEFISDSYMSIAYKQSVYVNNQFLYYGYDDAAKEYLSNRNIDFFAVKDSKTNETTYVFGQQTDSPYKYEYEFYFGAAHSKYVNVTVSQEPTVTDEYYYTSVFIQIIYHLIHYIFIYFGISAVLSIFGIVFLACTAGKRRGYEGIYEGFIFKIPFDLLTLFVIFIVGTGAVFLIDSGIVDTTWLIFPICFIYFLLCGCLFAGWVITFFARAKAKRVIKSTAIYRSARFIRKITKFIIKKLIYFFVSVTMVKKTAIICTLITLFEVFIAMILATTHIPEAFFVIFLFEKAVLLGAAVTVAVMMQRLKRGAIMIATGAKDTKINTSGLILDFRLHAETLNKISDGIAREVENRVKSERLKTELITNVSHDIKTPLTSIINYADLITKEPCENEKITEYSAVLLRQSSRLKNLIEDLVEASKAQTGNIDVDIKPLSADVMITQASGEYENKLKEKGLSLIITKPECETFILADGRRLWRVFDNLMNNICKYSMKGTRVYLSLEQFNGTCIFTFKNTSFEMLNISADELTERFIRADKSRHTEGNGLGLSIAKSLTELQGGEFNIFLDGDLFKVCLQFPLYKNMP